MTREEAERVAAALVTVDPVPEGYRVRRGRYVSFRVTVAGREAYAFCYEDDAESAARDWRDAIVRTLVGE
jgi:hypothetical protein